MSGHSKTGFLKLPDSLVGIDSSHGRCRRGFPIGGRSLHALLAALPVGKRYSLLLFVGPTLFPMHVAAFGLAVGRKTSVVAEARTCAAAHTPSAAAGVKMPFAAAEVNMPFAAAGVNM